MKQKASIVALFLAGLLIGVVATLLYTALSTGWYEYYWAMNAVEARETMNYQGWQPIPGHPNMLILRRPRYRIGW